uniref:ATP-dependent Clp protease proteolytic subunit n=1 Tax=Chromera velia CCMP2878 TaxID=1169474 RepID=A0A0G4HB09_9ALVE|eukprot:Cvel_6103.t1-p1 / transcript=Cvel_6103.t1 / gene=Cvel_6103 / organism=Chromera_velia_CCMP2878 / gene_product=ATP-dependent Clp protease proteolytic subunit, putative / transcript_product=ATP-dependent Clp protease proteolytic subunit, putative / location=Cvel_scaffold294:45353-47110(-) / protein_length=218 / sequence_SO=supercontig / SO=protein_coding / is_pseudo=false
MEEIKAPPNTPGRPDMTPFPVQIPQTASGLDVVSSLLKNRVIMLANHINDEVANCITAQMLHLAAEDANEPIKLYINTPSGSVTSGLAIFDVMNFVPCPVETVCFGMAAQVGAVLLSAGTKGRRRCLPHARVMLHQPMGGAQGQAADIEIQAKELLYTRELLNQILSKTTGKPIETIRDDTDRDFFITAQQAKDYGLIDDVLDTKLGTLEVPPIASLV